MLTTIQIDKDTWRVFGVLCQEREDTNRSDKIRQWIEEYVGISNLTQDVSEAREKLENLETQKAKIRLAEQGLKAVLHNAEMQAQKERERIEQQKKDYEARKKLCVICAQEVSEETGDNFYKNRLIHKGCMLAANRLKMQAIKEQIDRETEKESTFD